jgi:hypothetical protein
MRFYVPPELADRYFEQWPEQRAAILRDFEALAQQILHAYGFAGIDELARFFSAGDPFADRERCEELLDLLRTRNPERKDLETITDLGILYAYSSVQREDTGAVLSMPLTLGMAPIVAPCEVARLLRAGSAALQSRPPVYLTLPPGITEQNLPSPLKASHLIAGVLGDGSYRAGDLPKKLRTHLDAVATALNSVLDLPLHLACDDKDVRTAYRAFGQEFWGWFQARKLVRISGARRAAISSDAWRELSPIPKRTSPWLFRIEQAFATKEDFCLAQRGSALIHRTKADKVDVVLEPIDEPQFFPKATIEGLQRKLARIELDVAFIFAYIMSFAIERAIAHEHVELSLDALIRILGLDPRSRQEREHLCATLWDCLQIFAQTSVTGTLRNFHGTYIELPKGPMLVITGISAQDGRDVPNVVAFTVGDWFAPSLSSNRDYPYLGNLQVLAKIPARQPSGAWARRIGLALLQRWREEAQRAEVREVGENRRLTARFPPVTRRELFEELPLAPDPFEILGGHNPKRARDYWEGAITWLYRVRFISRNVPHARPQTHDPKKKPQMTSRGWKEAWLNEPLDLRPHSDATIPHDIRQIKAGNQKYRRIAERRRSRNAR